MSYRRKTARRHRTSSQASEAGRLPSDSRDGQTTEPSGPEVAPASRSPSPGSAPVQMTLGISGRSGSGSSESAALQSSLVSRLRMVTDLLGSTLFNLIWKPRVTPSRRWIYALRGSGLRTSDSGFTSWPTPRTPTGGPESGERKKELGRTESGGGDLQAVAELASWASPQARDVKGASLNQQGTNSRPLNEQALLASWATPNTRYHHGESLNAVLRRMESGKQIDLTHQVQLTASGPTPNGSPAPTGRRGQLNPAFSRWLMGFPAEWDDCAPTAMRSSSRKRQRS
jgi:hypothetical protein